LFTARAKEPLFTAIKKPAIAGFFMAAFLKPPKAIMHKTSKKDLFQLSTWIFGSHKRLSHQKTKNISCAH
jgi:hypothetical protein